MIENILPLLDKVRQTGPGRWVACCPVHEDRTPSLVINDKDGKIIIHCFGCGCGFDEFCQALDISIDEMFPEKLEANYSGIRKREYFNARDVLKTLSKEITVALLITESLKNGGQLNTDERGRLILAHARICQGSIYAGL